MSPFWTYFWPVFAFGLALGLVGGIFGFRNRRWLWAAAMVLAIGGAAVWHGPLGAGDRFAAAVENSARQTLVDYEMTQVTAHLHRAPLTRRLMLSGQADDFQQSELVRILSDVPGASSATWSTSGGMPLLLEGAIASVLGFLAGLLLAYLIELRRRYNAQWKW
jgi:hypothetical protein